MIKVVAGFFHPIGNDVNTCFIKTEGVWFSMDLISAVVSVIILTDYNVRYN